MINMGKINNYNQFLILEKYDDNIRAKLIELGISDDDELRKQISLSKRGNLAKYLEENGQEFTFGILKAIFKDAKEAKFKTDLKVAGFKLIPRLAPLALVPFFPALAVIALIFGTSRAFNKLMDPIFNNLDKHTKYTDFLQSVITKYMAIPEGKVNLKDRFSRAFVVSDRFIDALKPEVIDEFTHKLTENMEDMNDDDRVPDHYIENELKKYINYEFDVTPEIPLKK